MFGLNEALDQAGATIGPLVMSLILFRHGNYRNGFALLLIPALLAIAIAVPAGLISALHPNRPVDHAMRLLSQQSDLKIFHLKQSRAKAQGAG